jgi:hypothetical protein
MTDAALHDELLIRRLIERWAVWRDAGDWDRFATVWHPDGVMMATWFQGPFADFIRVTQRGLGQGGEHPALPGRLGHRGGWRPGHRADQDDHQPARAGGGVPCDIVCTGRFYDFMVRHQGEWKLLHRQPIYEKDRIDPLDPAAVPKLDAAGWPPSPRATATWPTSRPASATR